MEFTILNTSEMSVEGMNTDIYSNIDETAISDGADEDDFSDEDLDVEEDVEVFDVEEVEDLDVEDGTDWEDEIVPEDNEDVEEESENLV